MKDPLLSSLEPQAADGQGVPQHPAHLRFRDSGELLTLYVEKVYEDGWALGWCPERRRTMSVHPQNVVA